jgi:DNA-directed RNA polymerase subunit RPC12/RpoP
MASPMSTKADSNAPAIVCQSCGFKNSPPPANGRCVSCGAALETLTRGPRSREEELRQRYQQEGFSLSWAGISLGVQGVLTAAILVGLPMFVPALDFEGGNGMLMSIPIWFIGGLLVGLISPGKTFIEPVVAAFLIALPTVYYLVRSETVRTLPVFMYVIMSLIGVLFSLVGAYIGERIQMGPPPKKAE